MKNLLERLIEIRKSLEAELIMLDEIKKMGRDGFEGTLDALENIIDEHKKELQFILDGADGLAENIKKECNQILNLTKTADKIIEEL